MTRGEESRTDKSNIHLQPHRQQEERLHLRERHRVELMLRQMRPSDEEERRETEEEERRVGEALGEQRPPPGL
ncbi:hypothetical protein NQZ68_017773, partial [Dissostichus eleginoides]